jgi:hypothetical protein
MKQFYFTSRREMAFHLFITFGIISALFNLINIFILREAVLIPFSKIYYFASIPFLYLCDFLRTVTDISIIELSIFIFVPVICDAIVGYLLGFLYWGIYQYTKSKILYVIAIVLTFSIYWYLAAFGFLIRF